MMIVDRNSFIRYWLGRDFEDVEDGSPLWIPENQGNPPIKCEWFFLTKSREVESVPNTEFRDWCNENLEGDVRCFSWGAECMWFGFTLKSDIFIFKMRWGC